MCVCMSRLRIFLCPSRFSGYAVGMTQSSQNNLEMYEDRYGQVARRIARLNRFVRWHIKTWSGKPRHILVETRWRLGDEIMALPLFEALKKKYPDARITALTNYPDLFEDNPYVGSINSFDLFPERYINLRSGPRTVPRLEHYARLAGVPVPSTQPRLYYTNWSSSLMKEVTLASSPFIAVCTGASWPTKRWPIESWQTVCRVLETEGCRIVQLGHGDPLIGVGESFVDRTSVRDAACILHAAQLLVCCDSGLMHLALAAGTKVVALFGPTDPSILIRDNPNLTVITTDRECKGCWNQPLCEIRDSPVSTSLRMGQTRISQEGVCPRNEEKCLDNISPERVLNVVHGVLRGGDS